MNKEEEIEKEVEEETEEEDRMRHGGGIAWRRVKERSWEVRFIKICGMKFSKS